MIINEFKFQVDSSEAEKQINEILSTFKCIEQLSPSSLSKAINDSILIRFGVDVATISTGSSDNVIDTVKLSIDTNLFTSALRAIGLDRK